MNWPVLAVEIDFTHGPLTANASNTWTDITDYVHSIKIRRGRSDALDRIEAGTATLVLDNADRRFDPTYTSGAYYPNIKPTKKIRISAVFNSITYRLFTGYIKSWPPDWPGGLDATTTIQCVDAFAYFASKKLNGAYTSQVTSASIATWLTNISWPAADRNLSTGKSSIQAGTFVNTPALQHFQSVADVESGLFFVDGQGRPTFHDRHYRLTTAASQTSQGTYGDLDPELPWLRTTKKYDDANIWNEARITRTGGTEQVATDATSQAAYFTRTYAKSLPLLNDNDALSLAQWIVGRYGSPVFRYTSVTLDGMMTDLTSYWAQMLGRDISNRVTIKERPPGASEVITQACYVEGVAHDIAQDKWHTTFQLSAADALAYFILDSTTNGILDTNRLAY